MPNDRLLHIYLRDHLAVMIAGYELAKRSLSSNQGMPFGNFLATLVSELQEDRDTLTGIMRALGTGPDHLKIQAAFWGEKLGRLKLNGSLRGYSELSRITEIEGLCVIVEHNLCGWRTLAELAERDARLSDFDLRAPSMRAERQREELESHRVQAGARAFG